MKPAGFAEIVERVAVEVGWPKDNSLQMVVRRCDPLNVGVTPPKAALHVIVFPVD